MDLYKIRQELNLGNSLTNIPLRVTYYSRVSTDSLNQHTSLINQQTYFEEMIKNNKKWQYIEGYIDDGVSGTTDTKRTSFMQMINDAKEDKFDLIITKEISRFSRNTLDSIKYTRELLNYGVGILFINDNINTILPDSELRLTIMASLAQDEIRRLSERVKFGMKESIKKGNVLGNQKIYGYIKDKSSNKFLIEKSQSETIKRIYKLYANTNISLCKIAKMLKEENIKTNYNKYFSASSLSRLIRNTKYKGYFSGGKSEVTNYMTKKVTLLSKEKWVVYKDTDRIPPIVSEYLWNKANKKLDKLKN